jgi:DNA-binding response OmpR family regulator
MNNNSGLKKKILAVDDEVDSLKIVKRILEANGYEVITAFDGEEALVKIKSENPDVVVLDVMLPKLNGEEVCKSVRSDPVFSKLPVIMLTGKVSDADRIVGRVIGADIYITKPFNLEELIGAIKKLA